MSMRKRIEVWAYSLVTGAIAGGATAVSAWLGMAAAHQIGIDVPALNLKAVGVIFLSGMLPPIFTYLRQSPLPPLSDGQTEFISKTETVIKTSSPTETKTPEIKP